MPWGAIGAIGGAIAGSLMSRWNSEEAMEDQAWYNRDAQIWSARELPTIQVEGMRKAGVNPVLAYGNLGSVSAPSVNAVAADTPDFVSAGAELGKAVSRNSAVKLQQQELQNKKSEDKLTKAQANYYKALAKQVRGKTNPINPADPVNSAREVGSNIWNGIKNLFTLNSAEKQEVNDAVRSEMSRRGYDKPPTNAEKDAMRKRAQELHDAQRRAEEQRARVRARREGNYHDRRPVNHGYNKNGKK